MQRSFGYSLTGSDQEQCVFCYYGGGANDKTTYARVQAHTLGDYAVNLPFSALEMTNRNNNDVVALAGARLATATETNEGMRLNEARIKMLTGGDPITARRLYRESFTFDPTHKLVLAFNHKPVIADDSEGMWRRVRLIPFLKQLPPEQQDRKLPDKLLAEAQGILAWAVKGCLRWQKEGLGMPPAVAEATAAYRDESDHAGAFLEDCCIIRAGAEVASGDLWERYEQWTAANEEVSLPRPTFVDRLKRRGLRRGRSGHGGNRVWVGVKLRESKAMQCRDGDTVTHADAISTNFLSRGGNGKFSESPSAHVTTSAGASLLPENFRRW
jgi:putative DNA primase/helicase